MLLEQGNREGQWDARFPRNDELVGSFEAHVLLANLGNVQLKSVKNSPNQVGIDVVKLKSLPSIFSKIVPLFLCVHLTS